MKFNDLIPELIVTDFEKSKEFYTKVIGFTIEYQREEELFAFLSLGRCQLMIEQIGASRTWKTAEISYPFGRGINFQIKVPKIDPILAHLKKQNIQLFRDVEEKWYRKDSVELGNRQFLVQDPDGYLLRFFEDMGKRPLRTETQQL